MAGTRFEQQEYKNWLRGTLALQYWKEGLESFLDDQAFLFHGGIKNFISSALPACSSGCEAKQIKRDPRNKMWSMTCSTCDAWLQEIIKYHIDFPFPELWPENSCPQMWPTKPWEVVKLFMSFGCKNNKHAKDADAQATLSIFKNCQHFKTYITRQCPVEEMVKVRNALFHSANLSVGDEHLQEYHKTMVEFLQNMTGLSPRQNDQMNEAIRKIRELEDSLLDISLNKDLELKALMQRQNALDKDLKEARKILQKEQEKHSTKLGAMDKEMTRLKTTVNGLEEVSEKFQEFLKNHDLFQDMSKLSTMLEEQRKRINLHEHRMDNYARRLSALEEQKKREEVTTGARPALSWEEQCKDLQSILIRHYKRLCLSVQNPVENSDIGLEHMYVEPDIQVLRQSKGRDGLKNVNDEAAGISYRKIFYTDNYRARQIYITGDAGSGKSMLCKHLVELWCEAHGDCLTVESDESESDSDEDGSLNIMLEVKREAWRMKQEEREKKREEGRQILSQFKFLFYITLRDSLSKYEITEMIQSQILQHYANVKKLSLSVIMQSERCLIIVDGLDEWICPEGSTIPHFINPGIPGRDLLNETNVFLTTTRPWKFDLLELKDSEVDKHIELCGLDELSASQLCNKVIKILNTSKIRRKKKKELFKALEQKGLDNFKSIPVILIQLICLWFDDNELCSSQVQLYCSMLNLLLKKAQKKMTEHATNIPNSVLPDMPLHKCFIGFPFCQNHLQLIKCLSLVAFEALFDKTKENQLVFESSQMVIYGVDEDSISLCLKSGILSQNKMIDKCSVSEKKLSFLHKRFQEFLASVVIAGSDDVQGVAKRVREFCSTLDTFLEMSQVWLFVSGMQPNITQQLFDHFTNVVATDKRVISYRQMLRSECFDGRFIRDIQKCVTECVAEGSNNGHAYNNICLEDFHIDGNSFNHVEHLFQGNVKSVCINTNDISVDQLKAIFERLQQCSTLQKLDLYGLQSRVSSEMVTALIQRYSDCLTCLPLEGDALTFPDNTLTLTSSAVSAICKSSRKCLMALRLFQVSVTHADKLKLLNGLSQSSTIRHLALALICTDDGTRCRPMIDFLTMKQLQILRLYCVSLDNLHTVSRCMEKITLWDVTLPVSTLREFARRISQVELDVMVRLQNVTVTEASESNIDLETFLRSCPGLIVTRCWCKDSDKTWFIYFHTILR